MSELPEISVAILAGGLGTRLRSVVTDRPKVLAPVAGRPYLSHLIEYLAQYAIREVVLLVGHRADEVRAEMGDRHRGVRLLYSMERTPLGTGGAVRLALPLLRAPHVLLLNGDSLCDADLNAFQREQAHRAAEVGMILTRVSDTGRFGRVLLNDDGRVVYFAEKATTGPGWINAGVYLLARHLIAEVPADRPLSLERDLMPSWVAADKVWGFASRGSFLDIGTPESYAEADAFFAVSR